MESVWYYVVNGAQVGPVSFTELKDAAATGKLTPPDLVWKEGTADWVPARTIADLFPATPPAPRPPLPAFAPPTSTYASAESSPAPAPTTSGPPAPTYSLSPPPPAPSQSGAMDLPLSLDDDTGRSERPHRPRRDEPEPNAIPPQMPEWVKLIPVLLRRTFNPDPVQVAPVPDEEAALTRSGVMDVTARKLAVWRRSVLFVAAVPCAFAALFSLIDLISMSKEDRAAFTAFGIFLFYIQSLSLFVLPVASVFGALAYDRLGTSAKWVLIGGLVSFAVPLAVAFVPTEWLVDLTPAQGETVEVAQMKRGAVGFVIGIAFYITLVPTVLSLLPAVSRACIRLKMFLSESLVPGWGLISSAPLCVILTLSAFVLLYHAIGNMLLLVGLLLWIGAPIIYLSKFGLLSRPITSPADRATLAKVSLAVIGAMLAGVLLLTVFLFTTKFGLPGLEPKTIMGFDKRTSHKQPWSLDLHQKWIEYLGRSLFLTVFFTDLLLRIAISVWREERAFAGTPEAAGFDRTMSGLGSATLPRGSSPPPTA